MDQNSSSGSRNYIPFKITGNDCMRIISNGNVGIGTNTPGYLLDVNGSARVSTNLGDDGTLYVGNAAINYNKGANSIAIGANALTPTSGQYNVAIGNSAMSSNSSGSNNVGAGYQALSGALTASGITAVGSGALKAATSGAANTAVGYQALTAATTGANNTAMGYQALTAVTTGASNTAVGNAAAKATTGANNTAVGDAALFTNSTGANNTAVGYQALNLNATTADNAAVGYQALAANTAAQLTAMGSGALKANTTGNQNVAVGYNAMGANVGGGSNTAVGHSSMVANTSGGFNTALGYQALNANQTSGNLVAIGALALQKATGENNTGVGTNALQNTLGGTDNVAIGYSAGSTITSGSQNIVIGSTASTSTASVSNEIVIGYGAVGNGANSVTIGTIGTTLKTVMAGNVGIGTTAPTAVLDVNGAAKIRGELDLSTNNITNANQISATTNLVLQPTTGNVCIGRTTSTSGSMFDLSRSTGVRTRYSTSDTTLTIGIWPTTTSGGDAFLWNETGPIAFGANNGEKMRITSTGNVGIGTTNPAYTLDVSGTINSTNISRIIASGSGTSAANFEITGLDFSNFMMNEIIISWATSADAVVRMEVSYDGTSYYDPGVYGYEVTSYAVSPSVGASGIQTGTTNVGRYIYLTSTSGASCTGLCKLSWCGNMGIRSPVYWFSTYTRPEQGVSYVHGAFQSYSLTGNPIKLQISTSSGSLNAYKWRVIGNI